MKRPGPPDVALSDRGGEHLDVSPKPALGGEHILSMKRRGHGCLNDTALLAGVSMDEVGGVRVRRVEPAIQRIIMTARTLATTERESGGRQSLMPSRPILIVEDHDDTRAMVATLLASEGYKIATARNGAEALSVGRSAAPCLILLDLMMPIMSGEEFLLARDSIDGLRGVPVLIMSASPVRDSGRGTPRRPRVPAQASHHRCCP